MVDRRVGAAGTALVVMLGLAACVPEAGKPGPGPTAQLTDEASPGGSPGTADALDAGQAVDAAIRAEGDVVVELSRDREGGVEVWEVGVLRADGSGVELHLDAHSGEVLRERAMDLDAEQRSAPAVSAHDAIDAALTAVPGTIDELDLDSEGSRIVWEAQVDADDGGRFELRIDAATGEVLSQERDD